VEIARISVAGLLLSSLTALWMTASTFGFVPQGAGPPQMPAVSGQTGVLLSDMPALRDTPVWALRDLTFPAPGDPTDAYALKTAAGEGYLDQGTGQLVAWTDAGAWETLDETIYMLHTGRGAAVLGLIRGLMALGVPVMAGTGVWMWVAGRRGRPRLRGTVAAGLADTVLLVGSEGGSTWGFAATLQGALTAAGLRVHVAPMQAFAPDRYGRTKRIVVLAATYGDGVAPASAKGFLDRLAALPDAPIIPIAVLGFGDRSFPAFCGYAHEVAMVASDKGWPKLLPLDTVDRQSPQDFARWGRDFGVAIGGAAGTEAPALNACQRIADPDLASRLGGRGAGAHCDPALCPATPPAVAASDRARSGGLCGGRSAGDPARWITDPALLFAGLCAPRRVCRDLREPISGRPVLGTTA